MWKSGYIYNKYINPVFVPGYWPGVLAWDLASNMGQEALYLAHVTGLYYWHRLLAPSFVTG